MGFATFSQRLHGDTGFADWFAKPLEDVEAVARTDRAGNVRLVRLQRDLIDMIDFLDPDMVRIVPGLRRRLTSDAAVEAMPSGTPKSPPAPAQTRRERRAAKP